MGEFKQGKSLLVNALLGTSVCPIDDDIATSVPTVIRYGDDTTAALVYGAPEAGAAGDDITRPMMATERRRSRPTNWRSMSQRREIPATNARLSYAEVTLPRRFLASGLVVVDTPGVGGIGSAHSAATLAALPTADAVLLVSDAAQEYSEPEIAFLRQALKLCPNVACVLTKTDLYPHWRKVADLDRQHLQQPGRRAAHSGLVDPAYPAPWTPRMQT